MSTKMLAPRFWWWILSPSSPRCFPWSNNKRPRISFTLEPLLLIPLWILLTIGAPPIGAEVAHHLLSEVVVPTRYVHTAGKLVTLLTFANVVGKGADECDDEELPSTQNTVLTFIQDQYQRILALLQHTVVKPWSSISATAASDVSIIPRAISHTLPFTSETSNPPVVFSCSGFWTLDSRLWGHRPYLCKPSPLHLLF